MSCTAASCHKMPAANEEAPTKDGENYYVLPEWAEDSLKSIKEKAPRLLLECNENYENDLKHFNRKEEVETAIAVGKERLLQWMKEYAVIEKIEENLSIRDYMSSWINEGTQSYESKNITVTLEEKDQLMELILRQSELLMLYDTYLRNSCCELNEKKMILRKKFPELEGTELKNGKKIVRYDLPSWARDELKMVLNEKKIETGNDEMALYLRPLSTLDRRLRKDETERRLIKERGKIMKYLRLMQKVRKADILEPIPNATEKKNAEAMKTMILNRRMTVLKEQFFSLFPDLGTEKPDAGCHVTMENYAEEEKFNQVIHQLEDEQRQQEKLDLQENIIKMDKKLKAYSEFIKTTEEKVTSLDPPIPEFKVPEGKTDLNPEYYSIVSGRRTSFGKFNKTEYLETEKKIFLQNLVKGLKDDRLAMTEQKNLIMMDYLLKVLEEIEYYTEAFNIYLLENQEESMATTRAFLDIGQLVMAKEAEIEESQQIQSVLKSALLSLSGLLKFRRLCQTILYELSPFVWRDKYLQEKEKLKEHAEDEADTILSHLAMFKANALVPQPTLDKAVLFLANTVRNLGPPANYFTNSYQIDLAIRNLELENLYAFQHLGLLVKKREEYQNAKCYLIKSCNREIEKMESLVSKMRDQFYSKVQMIKIHDDRSQSILKNYWRVIVTSRPLMEAMTLINVMFEDFIGQREQAGSTLEMLDLLTEDIVNTQMELCELPKKAVDEIRAFIVDKEDIKRERLERDKRDYDATDKLLRTMKTSLGLTVAQQGHPPRYRSKPLTEKQKAKRTKPRTPISKRMLRRLVRLFMPTGQDDALRDTLASLTKEASGLWLPAEGASDSESSSPESFQMNFDK